MLTDLRDVIAELVVQPALHWLTKGTQMDDRNRPPLVIGGLQERVQLLPTAPVLNTVDDMVRDLTRAVDPGGYRLHCPVRGCTWELDIPAADVEHDLDPAAGRYIIRTTGVSREALERVLGQHLDWHAELTETDVLDGLECPQCGSTAPCAHATPDPDAAAGVDPRTGTPLEQSGVNVRLAP
jgi:hypothetical protein